MFVMNATVAVGHGNRSSGRNRGRAISFVAWGDVCAKAKCWAPPASRSRTLLVLRTSAMRIATCAGG